MFPIRDSHPQERIPIVNWIIILLNLFVFYLQLTSNNFEQFVNTQAFVSSRFVLTDLNSWRPLFVSMFMHGGFMHIISNLWFLHIFGDNVEDRLGHFVYAFFYLGAGVAATLLQYLIDSNSTLPMIGASGAVSGVLGAYFVLYRRSAIETVVFTPFGLWTTIELPAFIFLGYWFVLQLFNGAGSLVSYAEAKGGVAWFAHIGGFVFGYVMGKVLGRSRGELGNFVSEG